MLAMPLLIQVLMMKAMWNDFFDTMAVQLIFVVAKKSFSEWICQNNISLSTNHKYANRSVSKKRFYKMFFTDGHKNDR